MRLLTCGLSLALALGAAHTSRAQEAAPQDEGVLVRGAFVTSRPAAKKEAKPEAGAQASVSVPKEPGGQKSADGPKAADNSAPGGGRGRRAGGRRVNPASREAAAQRVEARRAEESAGLAGGAVERTAHAPAGLGIGYTLFMRGETGEAVRVSSAREFRSGESVRVVLETNADAYLYIFNAENDGAPQMIFPSGKLDRGANLVRAHVPREIPSSKEEDDRLRWFVFDDRPAAERLYIVVSRRPLEGVPAGEELVRLCAEASANCTWSPWPEQWAALKRSNEREQIATSQVRDDGRAQTPSEREAVTRGIGLASDAPLPSVIHMVTSSNANVLVATLDLVHK